MSLEEKFKIYSIVQMTSASTSLLASASLMFMIFRSHKKLSTPLHRLLLGLSISDFISSLTLSFASTLSPTDSIGWNSSGNMTLCRTQAFIHSCSQNASPLYNCSLCIYYLIEIKYTSLQEYLPKIEICLHIIPVLVPLIFSSIILSIDEFQPSGTSCSLVAETPIECRIDPEVDCDGGGLKDHIVLSLIWMTQTMVIVPLTIFISMILIYREVSAQEERTNQHRFSFSSRGSSAAYRIKIAARTRALAYSLGWLLSWTTMFVGFFLTMVLGLDGLLLPFPFVLVHYSLSPLQGLFNFIVYIFPKVTKRINQYKREGVANPKRFLLAFRNSFMSRGELLSRSSRTRSRLLVLNPNRGSLLRVDEESSRQSLQATRTTSGSGTVHFSHEEFHISSPPGLCDGGSPRIGVLLVQEDQQHVEEEEKTTEETLNMIEQGGTCQLEESELGTTPLRVVRSV